MHFIEGGLQNSCLSQKHSLKSHSVCEEKAVAAESLCVQRRAFHQLLQRVVG